MYRNVLLSQFIIQIMFTNHFQEITQEKQPKTDPELSLLVKSIKNKTKHKVKK